MLFPWLYSRGTYYSLKNHMEVKVVQTIKITITGMSPASVHIKECRPEEDMKKKLRDIFKQATKKTEALERSISK